MKKLICAAVVFAVGSSIFASEQPLEKLNELRASTDAIVISAAIKRMERDEDTYFPSSSGSSPVGATHLFPGQTGVGMYTKNMAPVCFTDENFHGHRGFYR